MSTTVDLVQALKNELKTAHMTYADLAKSLDMAESSVKRMLAKGDMPLTRVDAICRALKIDFAELARRVADAQPLLKELTHEQEKAVVKDKKLLLLRHLRAEPVDAGADRGRLPDQRGRMHRLPGAAGPHRHHRAAAAQPLPAQAGQDLPLAPARAGDGLLPRKRGARLLPRRLRRPGRGPAAGARLDQQRRWPRPSSTACSAWRRISRSSTRPTRSSRPRSARATPCCWACATGSSSSSRGFGGPEAIEIEAGQGPGDRAW